MTKYTLVSDNFSGNITFYYDSNGRLMEFQINSIDIRPEEHDGFLNNLNRFIKDTFFMAFVKKFRYRIRKETIDLSFERFMTMYGVARDKYKAEPKWRKLGERERYQRLIAARNYNRYCVRNPEYPKMYPATFLAGAWADNWDIAPDFGKKTCKFLEVAYDTDTQRAD